MSKPKVFEKPTGVKDYLPRAAAQLRRIERDVLSCMERWGYEQMMTPTLEFYDTVGAASSTSDNKLFKLLDKRGTTMVLRSDVTAPIARVVASLLKDEPLPLRLSYHANVFRALEEEAGREAEFFQTGVELVGDGSAEADAEMIALAIASLQAAGVDHFKIALGHVGFLDGVLHEVLPNDSQAQHELKSFLLERNYVGFQNRVRKLEVSEHAMAELDRLLRLKGKHEVCELARTVTQDKSAHEAIDHLCRIWEVLVDYGVEHHVLIDLTMIGNFSYYTGMTFEGYAEDLGFPVCNGGRYDNLLKQFGRAAQATGFALKTNRILELVSQRETEAAKRTLIVYEREERRSALAKAQQLRDQGRIVVVACKDSGEAVRIDEDGRTRFRGAMYDECIAFQKKGR